MNQTNGLKILAMVISIILWAYVRVTQGGVTQNTITQLELRVPLETKGGGSNPAYNAGRPRSYSGR